MFIIRFLFKFSNIIEGSRINLDLSNSISYDIRFLAKYPIGFYGLLLSHFFLKGISNSVLIDKDSMNMKHLKELFDKILLENSSFYSSH